MKQHNPEVKVNNSRRCLSCGQFSGKSFYCPDCWSFLNDYNEDIKEYNRIQRAKFFRERSKRWKNRKNFTAPKNI